MTEESVERAVGTAGQWRKRQEAYATANARIDQFEVKIETRYGASFGTCRSWVTGTERKALDRLIARRDAIGDQIIEFLYQYSPRHTRWGSGVPLHWICTELTFEDALTSGQLSTIPPPAYGVTPAYVRDFAAALPVRRGRDSEEKVRREARA